MTTYYAIANANGMISKRIEASHEREALRSAESSGREWIDHPATDAEDDFGLDGADKSHGECSEMLESAGLRCVISGPTDTDWDVWTK